MGRESACRLRRALLVACLLVVPVTVPFVGLSIVDGTHDRLPRVVEDWGRAEDASRTIAEFDARLQAYDARGNAPEPGAATAGAMARQGLDETGRALASGRPALAGAEALVADARQAATAADALASALASGDALEAEAARARFALVYRRGYSDLVDYTARASQAALASDDDLHAALSLARWLSLGTALIAAAGLVAYVVRDARRADRRAKEARTAVLAAQRTADQRVSMVNLASHELRNPLAVMTLSAQAVARAAASRGDHALAEIADHAFGAARRADALVAELLDLGRLDANRLMLEVRPTPLRPLLDDVVALTVEYRGPAPVTIEGEPGTAVTADPGRLAIILRNLVDNAVKYSPAGSPITIDVLHNGDRVATRVIDQGPGVAPADRERIFGRFERLHPAHTSGIGIGLHLSRELARRMGGDIRVGEDDAGRWFELVLPEACTARVVEAACA